MEKEENKYSELGVSSDKEGVHAAIANAPSSLFGKTFCPIHPDTFGSSEDHCCISHADGAGTKAILTYLYWKETGDISVFRNIVIDATVMNTDDLLCVGGVDPSVYTQTIDRNSFRIGDDALKEMVDGTYSFIEKMKGFGIDITHHGGETADVIDSVRTLTINANITMRMLRSDVIKTNIKPGSVILGFASYGKATYEDEYNSGIGSNGLTLLRHGLFSHEYAEKYPEITESLILEKEYTGRFKVNEAVPEYGIADLGKYALSPTRTYAPIVRKILQHVDKSKISAIIHCSGGGQTKCKDFGRNIHIVKDTLFPVQPLFSLIQSESKEKWKNMYKIFNMGHRLEIFCDQETAYQAISISNEFDVQAKIIGYVEECIGNKLTIDTEFGSFEY